MKWKLVYKGAVDVMSATGHAAPSWHTFDKRVYQCEDLEIELVNLRSTEKLHTPGKIGTYRVTLSRKSEVLEVEVGYDWHQLVQRMKRRVVGR